MKSLRLFILIFLVSVAGVFSPFVFADAKSDYDYQYGLYRQGYSEYVLLKSDYLQTLSLDNQQKAMIAAKQTILARDLAKASFAWYLIDLTTAAQTNYAPTQPIFTGLATAREYFLSEVQRSQGIVTQADLKNFTDNYLKTVIHHDRIIKFGVIAQKITSLVRIQMDSKNALENLIPRLPAPTPAALTNRIEELRQSAKVIDEKIDLVAKGLNIVEAEEEADAEIFFSSRVEKLVEIRTLQLNWINLLIDIDKNYVQVNR